MSLLPAEKFHLLQDEKVLLAFSGGADSTALFFSLIEHKIPFDIAIVHYGIRSQAEQEVAYAKELAQRYRLECHLLTSEKITQNFEYEARQLRYDFFERLACEKAYTYLLTAHHLQDRLEWMLMQLCKGAGAAELLGMKEIEKRPHFTLYRPFLEHSKEEILNYLHTRHIRWFHDSSNDDKRYRRNYFRHEIAAELIRDNFEGIQQSFRYLEQDVNALIREVTIHEAEEMSLFFSTGDRRSDIYHIDKILKSKHYMLTSAQREELRTHDEIIAGRKFLVVQHQGIYYIAPYVTDVMEKDFKEKCRELGVPKKLRPYLFRVPLAFILFTRFLPCSTALGTGDIDMHSK